MNLYKLSVGGVIEGIMVFDFIVVVANLLACRVNINRINTINQHVENHNLKCLVSTVNHNKFIYVNC